MINRGQEFILLPSVFSSGHNIDGYIDPIGFVSLRVAKGNR